MSDELLTAVLPESDLRVILCTSTAMAQEARRIQQAHRGSALVLAQGLTAGVLLGALQKTRQRINFQLECGGPLRGMFIDADNEGTARGYVKNPNLDHVGNPGAWEWRPLLGNSGYLSVLRDLGGGEFYRSSVELEAFEISSDLERYFRISEQLETRVAIEELPIGDEPLGIVAGLLIQPLPDGDRAALEALGNRIRGDRTLRRALVERPDATASSLLQALFPDSTPDVTGRMPVAYRCTCDRERVVRALLAVGRAELQDILDTEGKAEMTCQFCLTQYTVEGEEIRGYLAGLSAKE